MRSSNFDTLSDLNPTLPTFATEVVDRLLVAAQRSGASDLHFQPTGEGLEVRWRIDGVLQPVVLLPKSVAPNIVARLKVLADLLTYRSDVPQEGRIKGTPGAVETRVSTFPTLHGERAVVRLFGRSEELSKLDDLGFPIEVVSALRVMLVETSGLIVLAGPAGSGKSTTIYACLREMVETSGPRRSLATLEDPIEVAVPGVSQSQVNPGSGFTLESGLRSLLRQDPEVLAVGEIRDAQTAEVAFQAALTGHLVLTTFHAGSAAGVIGRLSDMGIEPYLLRSGILAIVCQRLARCLCESCKRPADLASAGPEGLLGWPANRAWTASGCEGCQGTGYVGRKPLVEWLVPGQGAVGRAILSKDDVTQVEALAAQGGMVTRWARAVEAIEAGWTSPEEARRVLGFSKPPDD